MPFVVPSVPSATTGNARGVGAADLQQARNGATKIASGANSVIAGGENNTSSSDHAAIGGGKGNTTNGAFGVVAGGYLNSLNYGWSSSIAGGRRNTTGGSTATIGGGYYNTASAESCTIPGGYYAKADKYCQQSYASGRFAATGDAQTSLFVVRNVTTDATQTELYLNGVTATQRMTIASDTTWMFSCYIVARRTDADNESAAYKIEGCIDNNAGTTALVGSITTTVLAEDTASWDVTAEADNANDALVVKVTGEAAKTVRWVCRTVLVEVTG